MCHFVLDHEHDFLHLIQELSPLGAAIDVLDFKKLVPQRQVPP